MRFQIADSILSLSPLPHTLSSGHLNLESLRPFVILPTRHSFTQYPEVAPDSHHVPNTVVVQVETPSPLVCFECLTIFVEDKNLSYGGDIVYYF
jgi:hypothetical protein